MILDVLLDIHGDLVGLLGMHGINEAKNYPFVPVCGDEGVHITCRGHHFQQAIIELHDGMRIPVIIRINSREIFCRGYRQIIDLGLFTRLSTQQHVHQADVLRIGTGITHEFMTSHPGFHRFHVGQYICIVKHALGITGLCIPAPLGCLLSLAHGVLFLGILQIVDLFGKQVVFVTLPEHLLLATNRYTDRDHPGHHLVQLDQVLPDTGTALECCTGIVNPLFHTRHDVALFRHPDRVFRVTLPVEDVGVIDGNGHDHRDKADRHPLAGPHHQFGDKATHSCLPGMSAGPAGFSRRGKLGHQQWDQGGRGHDQGQHPEHSEIGVGLVERDIHRGQRSEAHHVRDNGKRRRHNRMRDREMRCLLAVA